MTEFDGQEITGNQRKAFEITKLVQTVPAWAYITIAALAFGLVFSLGRKK